jgi:hypothetical protein
VRIWKRAWFWVLAATLLFLGMLASLFLTDEPPHADEDLRGFRRTVAEAENGFEAVDLAADAVVRPEDEPQDEATFDIDWARAYVAKNDELLRRIPECLSRPQFQVPEARSWGESRGYLRAWMELNEVVRCRARVRAREGKLREALEDGLLLVRFGHRIEGAQGALETAIVGLRIRTSGAAAIIEAARGGTLPAGELLPLLVELRRHERNLEGFKDALRGQYCACATMVDDIAVGRPTYLHELAKHTSSIHERILLKANQTKRILAEELRRMLLVAGATFTSREERSSRLAEALPADAGFLRVVVNHPGKRLLQMHLTAYWQWIEIEKHAAFHVRAAETFLALKAFETATGKLPDSLAALVPEHLPVVPEDPFDGQPLRYDAARRIVYSVGADLIDAQGSAEEAPLDAMNDSSEPTLRL